MAEAHVYSNCSDASTLCIFTSRKYTADIRKLHVLDISMTNRSVSDPTTTTVN